MHSHNPLFFEIIDKASSKFDHKIKEALCINLKNNIKEALCINLKNLT